MGIDVSKDSLSVCLMEERERMQPRVLGTHSFANGPEGFVALMSWGESKCRGARCLYLMEATGVYHERLADELYACGCSVSVELPNKIKNYSRSLNVKTKTDSVDARVIARYGLEMSYPAWAPMTAALSDMRGACRALADTKKEHVRMANRVHALTYSSHALPDVVKTYKRIMKAEEKAVKELEAVILTLCGSDAEFDSRVDQIAAIKGVRKLTVIAVLCETNGFHLCSNVRQVASYAGLDVTGYQSGTVARRGHISKKGNARIRQLLYLPAMVAGRYGPESIKGVFRRVEEKNPNAKKKAIIAAERKLLILIYRLWVKKEAYNPDYVHA